MSVDLVVEKLMDEKITFDKNLQVNRNQYQSGVEILDYLTYKLMGVWLHLCDS